MAEDFLPTREAETGIPSCPDKQQSTGVRKRIKHLLIGDPSLVRSTIHSLHILGYAEVREWSKLQPAGVLGDPGEAVSVLIRYIQAE